MCPQRQSIPDWPLGDVLIELIPAPIGNLGPPNTRIGNPPAIGLVTLIDQDPTLRCPHDRVVTEGVSISAWARARASTS